MKNTMKKTITKEFFDEYATKLIDFYERCNIKYWS